MYACKLTGSGRYIKDYVSFLIVSLLSRTINRFTVAPVESSLRSETFNVLFSSRVKFDQ